MESRSGFEVSGPMGDQLHVLPDHLLLSCMDVQPITSVRAGVVVPGMSLRRADIEDAAVTVLEFVPTPKAVSPGVSRLKVSKALGRKLRAALGCAKQRLGICVVIADVQA